MATAALFVFAVACIVVCSFLRSRRSAAVFALVVFLVLAVGVPFGELGWKCMQSRMSEGCVWGKSLLPISIAVGAVVGAVFAAMTWFMALGFQKRRRNASGATESSHALDAGDD